METISKDTYRTKNVLGLNMEYKAILTERLNNLLSGYQVFYLNVRGFHWNIKGDKFFELHAQFEALYEDLHLKIDELAERILTLGGQPLHSYTDYLSRSEIRSVKSVSDGREAVSILVQSFSILLALQRELLKLSAEANDEGTNSLMSDYIREQEKRIWMYEAFLSH